MNLRLRNSRRATLTLVVDRGRRGKIGEKEIFAALFGGGLDVDVFGTFGPGASGRLWYVLDGSTKMRLI
jgi:hypothetical protein